MRASRDKTQAFLDLHHGPGVLLIPNAWDAASAVVLAGLGFPAVATTSAGIAFGRGYPDGERIPRDEMMAVLQRIATPGMSRRSARPAT